MATPFRNCAKPTWRRTAAPPHPTPLDKEYSKQIKSDIADIKNTGGRKAGTITAAAFLKEFAEGLRWVHSTATPLIVTAPQQTTIGPAITQFSYDGQAYGTAPSVGNLTSQKLWDDVDNKWITSSQAYGS